MDKRTTVIPGKLKLKTNTNTKTLQTMKSIFTKDIKKDDRNNATGFLSESEEAYIKHLEEQINNPEKKDFGYITQDNDNRTAAERLFDERKLNKLPDKIKKEIDLTFKKKYEEFNKKLSKLPEHYDIPKVGPG
jgi:hypothetical protein